MKLVKKISAIGSTVGLLVLPLATRAALDPTLGLSNGNVAVATGLGSQDVRQTIGKIINVALSLLGIVVLVIIIYGGFLWMTAGGNDDKVSEAKKWIFGGIIGLVIILSAYAIASFVISNLVSATV
jgi:heme/copper-type cytochrome/quinol oxidase subunit 2